MATNEVNFESEKHGDNMDNKDYKVKIICLGDSAVGKSK